MKKLQIYGLLVVALATLGGCGEDVIGVDCEGTCFPNGVAAGDVDQSSVMLWARASFPGTVRFEYGTDPDFDEIDGHRDVKVVIDEFIVETDDGEVLRQDIVPSKALISGLVEGTQYYYRACRERCPSAFPQASEAHGSFRTPHADFDHGLRFGVSSCWRGDMRPFASIKNVPERDLDFFVALGDTVYADSSGSGGRATDLRGFRSKYKLAVTQMTTADDNMFALARASTAFFVDIDDHEVVNDFAGGAPPRSQLEACECNGNDVLNDLPFGGCPWNICFCDLDDPAANCDRDYINETDLFTDALQAWHEYHPVRQDRYGQTGDPRTAGKSKLYRHRTFGKDAAMFMLDTRSFRDEESLILTSDPRRTMLGKAQFDELLSDLRSAEDDGVTWKFIMVPEPMQHLGPASAADRFEGYAHERALILDYIERECISNVVFISGDIHGTVANNLTYKKLPLYVQRFSSSWGISTGAAAYTKPIGVSVTFSEPSETHEYYDLQFQTAMDAQLAILNRPRTGLGPEDFHFLPLLQRWNRSTPATLLRGSYVAAHTFGWTEFEIDPGTQELLVTTYGIDWYPVGADVGDPEQFIVSQFKVATNSACHALPCINDDDCCEDCFCNLIGGVQGGSFPTCVQLNSLENGELCSDDDACQSEICVIGICGGCQPVGDICGEIDDCCSDNVCSTLLCVGPNSLDAFVPCTTGDACRSGSCAFGLCEQVCGDGFCDGVEMCGGDDGTGLQCRSDCGQCGGGSLCGDDDMCESGLCNGVVCTSLQADGRLCIQDDGCQSGLCDLALCTAPHSRPAYRPCSSGDACSSKSCTFGTCQQICGDGFCDGTEQCGGKDDTILQCRSDCGQCGDGSLCSDDKMCASGLCNAGTCTPPQVDGQICVRHAGCQSGLCDLFSCTTLHSKGWLSACVYDRACVSGNCLGAVCTRP